MSNWQLWTRWAYLLVFVATANVFTDRPCAAQKHSESGNFAKHVLPILDAKCVSCHGAEKHESGLRLDSQDAAFRGGDNGPAIVAKDAAGSLLLQVLTGKHASIERMPLEQEPLSNQQIDFVRNWIDQGAEWPESLSSAVTQHWAFSPPVRPELPVLDNDDWVRNPVDRFVLRKLRERAAEPTTPADKATLLRRLSLDLIGLPPSLLQVDEFLADESTDAVAAQVEQLLKSPHFGERWGKLWLDAARYADSDGFEKDKPRFIWAYRDWVINAINADMPYDQFVIRQIAGDQLPNASTEDVVATGFLRNAMLNEEGGVDPEQFRTEGLFDRMDCIGKSVLGLTIQCAQCHSHKFDPISQTEYYRLFAFLNNDHEASVVYHSPQQRTEIQRIQQQIQRMETQLQQDHPDWQQRMTEWEDHVRNNQPEWTVLEVRNTTGDNGVRYYYYDDGSLRASSYAPTQWTAYFTGTTAANRITAFRLEQLPDPNLPGGGPGRSIKGMSALSEFQIEAAPANHRDATKKIEFASATADFASEARALESEFVSQYRVNNGGDKRTYGPVEFAIDNDGDTAWGIDAGPGRRNVARKAVFVLKEPLENSDGTFLNIGLQQNHGGDNSDDNQNHNLGRFRLSVTDAPNPSADPLPLEVREILQVPASQRTAAQAATVFSYWRTTVAEYAAVNQRIEEIWQQFPEGTPTLTLASRTGNSPHDRLRTTHIFKRGDWLQPGEQVQFGTPAALHPLPEGADASRLTFARWLVDRRSPTTARVIVNRVWQAYFGVGLVDTPEDFGVRSTAPSHPELLDWLACELMDNNWSLKHIHRLICNSATYQQTSHATTEAYQADPQNRLLARGARFRVDAELVRDIALTASGLLNSDIGGRSVYPPAPEFLFQPPVSYGPKVWDVEPDDQQYRRSLYVFKFRSVPYPTLQTFDSPNGDFSCVRRERSNTPLQSLITLNEPQFMECARALAKNTLSSGGTSDESKITFAFRSVLSRTPSPDELNDLHALLKREMEYIGQGWVNPIELATGTDRVPTDLKDGQTVTQLAAYTVLSRVLLNLDETLTKE